MCHCPKCRELSDSEQSLLLENALLAALKGSDARATLAHLAYKTTLEPPRKIRPHLGIFLEFAPIQRDHGQPLSQRAIGSGQNNHGKLLDLLDANLEVFPRDTAQALDYVNVWSDWPAAEQCVDAALVIAETLKDDDSRLRRLKQYVEQGGKMLVFGKPAASLSAMLPVTWDAKQPFSENPQRLQTLAGGPWDRFQPTDGPTHYGLRVAAKPGSAVLAKWNDGAPAVVSGNLGKGQAVFVGASSGQVWQPSAAFDGADELSLRLLYWMTGGEQSLRAMLDCVEKDYMQEEAARIAVRDRALANLKVNRPKQFVVVSRNNVGRFGWLVEEGGLAENLGSNGVVTGPTTRSFSFGGTQPVVNVGTLQDTGAEATLSLTVDGDSSPRAAGVAQNWFAKPVTWKYGNGQTVQSMLSLGTPGMLWEGNARQVEFVYRSATHLAFASPSGIRVVARGESIAPADLAEGWLLAFTARADVRDMPQLFVLTRRPARIRFDGGIQLAYDDGGFGAAFSSRLWGIRRLVPGATAAWAKQVSSDAVAAARRWNQLFLSFPVDCDEIAWVEGEQVLLADRYKFRSLKDDWSTQPLSMAPLPPTLSLAKAAGAPVELPNERISMECATKFGPLEAVPGDSMLVRLPLPPRDHRALVPIEGRMVLQEALDQRAAGLGSGQMRAPAGKNEGAGRRAGRTAASHRGRLAGQSA